MVEDRAAQQHAERISRPDSEPELVGEARQREIMLKLAAVPPEARKTPIGGMRTLMDMMDAARGQGTPELS